MITHAVPEIVCFVQDPTTQTVYPLPVVRVELRYALNQIPAATVMLGVGVGSDLWPSTAHALLQQANTLTRLPTTLFVRNRLAPAPADHLLFAGYTAGVHGRTVRGQRTLTLSLLGWLSDLAISSSVSAALLPSDVGALASRFLHGPAGPSATQVSDQSHLVKGTELIADLTLPAKKKPDLWTYLLYPLCYRLAAQYYDSLMVARPRCIPEKFDFSNAIAIQALRRFETDDRNENVPPGQPFRYSNGLRLKKDLDQPLFNSLKDYLGEAAVASFVEATLWDKLVMDLLPSVSAALVPLPDRALVVPYSPGVRFEPEKLKRIPASDISLIETAHLTQRPVQGILVVPEILELVTLTGDEKPTHRHVSACYRPESAPTGLFAVAQMPHWVSRAYTAAAEDLPEAVADRPPTNQKPKGRGGRKLGKSASADGVNWDHYAKFLYLDLVLRQRNFSIATALRTDIGPGTHIQMELPDLDFGAQPRRRREKREARGFSGPGWFCGMVSEVQIVIDWESRQAQTNFRVDHVRSEREYANDELNLGPDQHPFYSDLFAGAPLIEGLDWYT